MCFCVYFLNFSALISGYLQIYISDSFSLCKLFLCVCSSSTEIKSTIKYIQTLAAGCQGQNQEKVKESEGERERERPSVSFSLSLSNSRSAIRNHDNRWEPPPGCAWECSGIIASGTPSTITQRTQAQGSRLENWRDQAAMAHKHGHGRERVSRH